MIEVPRLASEMTPFPYSVSLDDPLERARALMNQHTIHHLPVQDQQSLVGVISSRDIDVALAAGSGTGQFETLRVGDVCTPDPYAVSLDEPLADVLAAMATRHIGSVIVTRHGKLVGVFTATDACRGFAALLRECGPQDIDPEAA